METGVHQDDATGGPTTDDTRQIITWSGEWDSWESICFLFDSNFEILRFFLNFGILSGYEFWTHCCPSKKITWERIYFGLRGASGSKKRLQSGSRPSSLCEVMEVDGMRGRVQGLEKRLRAGCHLLLGWTPLPSGVCGGRWTEALEPLRKRRYIFGEGKTNAISGCFLKCWCNKFFWSLWPTTKKNQHVEWHHQITVVTIFHHNRVLKLRQYQKKETLKICRSLFSLQRRPS